MRSTNNTNDRRQKEPSWLEGSCRKPSGATLSGLADKLRYSGHGSVLQCCWCVSEQAASLHDGSVNHRLDVVPPVAGVDYSLSL